MTKARLIHLLRGVPKDTIIVAELDNGNDYGSILGVVNPYGAKVVYLKIGDIEQELEPPKWY